MKNTSKSKWILSAAALVVVLGAGAFLAVREMSHAHGDEDGHAHAADEKEKGAHGHDEDDGHGHGGGEGREGGHAHAEPDLLVADSALALSGAVLGRVEERLLILRLPVLGRIVLNEDRTAHLHARYPGVIVEVTKQLGERVSRGDVLARIESNESLEPYALVARKGGVVIGRHASLGESVTSDDELFTISDLSGVWVDFQVYRRDFARLRAGQRVRVSAEGVRDADARLTYLSPAVEKHSQTLLARAELSNAGGEWTPGLFVQGEVAVEEFTAPAVPRSAVQEIEGSPAVFVREAPGRYRAEAVTLGRRDGDWLELLEGPAAGAEVVTVNSYLLKAEMGKGEAGHDH